LGQKLASMHDNAALHTGGGCGREYGFELGRGRRRAGDDNAGDGA
jgi:hypothetical protein